MVAQALAATGTLDLEARPFATLSGGEKQRVIIAAALAQRSRPRAWLLLLDEPPPSLDLAYQLEIARCSTLQPERGAPIVLSTHDLNFAAACAGRSSCSKER